MLLRGALSSFIMGALANVLVAGVLSLSAPVAPLVVWTLLCWLTAGAFVLLTLHHRHAVPLASLSHATFWAVALCATMGALRGVLAWLVPADASALTMSFVVSMLIAFQASMMAFLLPLPLAFVAYTLPFTALLAVKLFTLDEPEFWAMGGGAILFSIGILFPARKAAQDNRRMVELRFENVDLVARLQVESEHARAARDDAEHANRAKSRFLAAASHDLRQPLHAQGLFLEVLSRSALDPRQREVLANAHATWDASYQMLNALLDISRLDAGVVAVRRSRFRLLPLLNRVEAELAPQADAKGIVYRVREADVVLDSDPTLLELILRNLVSNAIRYTQQGGVLIACRRRADRHWLEIWDTGIGIAPEHQTEVFTEFHQIGNPERDRRKGLGLGLAIAQRLAAALGETLTLRSRPGRGSVFALSLPLTQQAPQDAWVSDPVDMAPSLRGLRVLVVDDDAAVRAGMQLLLRDLGAQCEVAETTEQALRSTQILRPALVICDYRLRDEQTGTQALAALRAMQPGLQAMLITGDTAPDRLREAQASGYPLLHKPVQPAELLRAIRRLVPSAEHGSAAGDGAAEQAVRVN